MHADAPIAPSRRRSDRGSVLGGLLDGILAGVAVLFYASAMANAARVLQEALALSAEERARLAHELISSLDDDDGDATAAWSDEIGKRIDDVEAGTAELDTWETVRARLESAGSR